MVLVVLLLMALGLLLCLPQSTWVYGVAAFVITVIYPWMKRFIHVPQLVLGIAFAFSIPMVFVCIQNQLPLQAWALFWATVLWTVAYDTMYAKVDKQDDLKLGLKSSAIFFGKYDNLATLILQCVALALFAWVGITLHITPHFYISIFLALILTCYQQWLLRSDDPKKYFAAFLNNAWWGAAVFLGFLIGLI